MNDTGDIRNFMDPPLELSQQNSTIMSPAERS